MINLNKSSFFLEDICFFDDKCKHFCHIEILLYAMIISILEQMVIHNIEPFLPKKNVYNNKIHMQSINREKNKDIILRQLQKVEKGSKIMNYYNKMLEDDQMEILEAFESKAVKVEKIFLSYNSLTSKGIFMLSRLDWSNLTFLQLLNNNIGPKGCKFLSMMALDNIEQLLISCNKIENQGVLHLVKGRWRNLWSLQLECNLISQTGVKHLTKHNWKNLKIIDLVGNLLNQSTLKNLLLLQNNLDTIYSSLIYSNRNQEEKIQLIFKSKFSSLNSRLF